MSQPNAEGVQTFLAAIHGSTLAMWVLLVASCGGDVTSSSRGSDDATAGRQSISDAEPPQDHADSSSADRDGSAAGGTPVVAVDASELPAMDAGGEDAPDTGWLDAEPATDNGALGDAEATRLAGLGAGVDCSTVADQDMPLVQRGVRSSNAADRGWAYLAVEKLAHCPDLLDRQFVDSVFSETLEAVGGTDLELARFAARGLGELSDYTDLLTADQVAQAYELAMVRLASNSVDVRGVGLGLLGELLRQLNPEQMFDAFNLLFGHFEAWRQSYSGSWDDFYATVIAPDGTPELRYQLGSIETFLRSCRYVEDSTQTANAYSALTSAMDSGQLEISALPSIAGVARKLPEPERSQALDLVIAGLSSQASWYDRGSGMHLPANYANDALLIIEPWLSEDEIRRALDAIASQATHPDHATVFASTVELLNGRLAELTHDAGA